MPRHSPCALSSLTSSEQTALSSCLPLAVAPGKPSVSLRCSSSRSQDRFRWVLFAFEGQRARAQSTPFSPGSQELCRHNFTEESSAFVAFTLLKFPQRAVTFALDTPSVAFSLRLGLNRVAFGHLPIQPSLRSDAPCASTLSLRSSVACSHISGMFSSLFSFQGATSDLLRSD